MKNVINSIALYGSRARKDWDQYSDSDLLIVSEAFENQFNTEKYYNDIGFSSSAYTFRRLEMLSERKSLFIQHLKQDAKIIVDTNGKLVEILHNYSPKDSYTEELIEARKYFQLLRCIPDSPRGIGWAYDIIAIGIRNFNILNLANKKIYEFSNKIILEQSREILNLNDQECELLLDTRIAKKMYREKNYNSIPKKSKLKKVINVLQNKYSIDIDSKFLGPAEFVEYSRYLILFGDLPSYERLRLFEALVISMKNSIYIEQIQRIIENPKFYVFNFDNHDYVENLLKQADACAY